MINGKNRCSGHSKPIRATAFFGRQKKNHLLRKKFRNQNVKKSKQFMSSMKRTWMVKKDLPSGNKEPYWPNRSCWFQSNCFYLFNESDLNTFCLIKKRLFWTRVIDAKRRSITNKFGERQWRRLTEKKQIGLIVVFLRALNVDCSGGDPGGIIPSKGSGWYSRSKNDRQNASPNNKTRSTIDYFPF